MTPILNIILAILATTVIAGADIARIPKQDIALPSPAVVVVPTPTPIPTDIVGYINYKFGEDAWKAFKVLDCENRGLNPFAQNINKDGSIDRGYWQINTIHPVTDACAKDAVCSTNYAYRMYINDDKTFVRWTCGRYYGI